MRKVRQLKESLLGWGGYKDVQDKIYLEKEVVYMRGGRTYNQDGSINEKIYFVNIDGTSSDKCVTITIPAESTVDNEKFFFDKTTQCIVRTAVTESGNGGLLNTYHPNKKIAFDLYDPNTFELLDSHVINAVSGSVDSNGSYFETARRENCSQGLYSFYCNGINAFRGGSSSGRSHHTAVYIYIPRRKRVYEVLIGETKEQYTPIQYNTSDLNMGPQTRDTLIGVYNESKYPGNFDNVSIDIYMPNYSGGPSSNMNQFVYHFNVNLETNPHIVGCDFTPNYNVVGNPTILSGAILGETDENNYITVPSDIMFYQYASQSFFAVYLDLPGDDKKMVLMRPEDPTAAGTTFYIRSETVEGQRQIIFGREYYNPDTEEQNIFESTAGSVIYDGPGMYYFSHRCTQPTSDGSETILFSKFGWPVISKNSYNATLFYTQIGKINANASHILSEFYESDTNVYKCESDFPYYALRLADTSIYVAKSSSSDINLLATLKSFAFNTNTTGLAVCNRETYPSLPLTASYCYLSDGTNINNATAHATTKIFPNHEFVWELTSLGRLSKLCSATSNELDLTIVLSQDGYFIYKTSTTDFNSWTQAVNITNWSSIATDGTKFVALNLAGNITTLTSIAGGWSTPTDKLGNHGWGYLTYLNGTYLASGVSWTIDGSTGEILRYDVYLSTSSDGITWTTPAKSSILESRFQVISFIAYQGKFYAITTDGYASTSTDGVNWSAYERFIPDYFNPRRFAIFGDTLYVEGKPTEIGADFVSYFVFIKTNDGVNWSNVIYPIDSASGISTSSSYDFITVGDKLLLQTRGSSSTLKLYMTHPSSENEDYSPEYVNMTFYSSIYGSYVNLCGLESNMYGYKPSLMMSSQLPSSKWDGRTVFMGGPFMYMANYSDAHGISTMTNNKVYHGTISTATTYIPRFTVAPKIVSKPLKITSAGEFETICGNTLIKDYDDEACAMIIGAYDASVGNSTSETPSIIYRNQSEHVILVGTSIRAVTQHIENSDVAPVIKKFRHGGNDYYMSDYRFTTNITDEIANLHLPYLVFSNETMYSLMIEDYGYIVLSAIKNDGAYGYIYLIKDYYTNNTNNALSFNFFSLGNGKTPVTVYDACTGSQTTNNLITNEQNYIPGSEKSVVITTCSNPSESNLPHYMNIVRSSLIFDSVNSLYKIVPTTIKVDANTNSVYLADNVYASAAVTANGAFVNPPVAIADGDLADPESEEIPTDLYAWSRTEAGETYYIFTSSLNDSDVVNHVYYVKTPYGKFFKPEKQPSTTIASFQSNYITTKTGVQYIRAAEYDYSMNIETDEYVPVYLKGWDA